MKTLVIALDELAKLFVTRRGWFALAAFGLLWGVILIYAIVPASRWLEASAESGLLDALRGTPFAPLLDASGLTSLGEWPSPQIAVYRIALLSLLPTFAVLVAADQTASDLERGTLRFHALRAGRATLFLGRFAGQCLIQLGLVLVTLASVLAVVARR